MIWKFLVRKVQCRKKAFKLDNIYLCAYLVWFHLWMTMTVPGWPRCQGGGRRCCCPCPRPSSPTPAWQSPACFPPLTNAPLPSVACLRNKVSWQTNQFCSEQSLSSHVHLVYHWKSANCAGSPIDCSNWVQLQLYSFHFLYSVRCQLNCRNFGTNDEF